MQKYLTVFQDFVFFIIIKRIIIKILDPVALLLLKNIEKIHLHFKNLLYSKTFLSTYIKLKMLTYHFVVVAFLSILYISVNNKFDKK